jgi:hypothetical protein
LSRQDPSRERDEPVVRRWPPAWRLIFLLLAGIVAWVLVVVVAGFFRRHLGL